MTSTQEPNTMAPQSALCICSRKWKAKLIVPIYFGTKTSEFCLRIISFSSLESELSFDSKDSGCEKDGVHLPQTSGFCQWTSGLSILFVLWTSESSEKKRCLKCFSREIGKFLQV